MSLEAYSSKTSLNFLKAPTGRAEPLSAEIPAPRTIAGLAPEDSKLSIELRVGHGAERRKMISFEGFTSSEAQWTRQIIEAVNVPLGGLEHVVLKAMGENSHGGAAQYIPETRSLIIFGGLLREAAESDARRALGRKPGGYKLWEHRPDKGKFILAYAISHELAGHSRDANLHLGVSKDPKTGKLIATLPADYRGEYDERFIETLDVENRAIAQLCLQSIRTGVYLDSHKQIPYHRTVCDGWQTALARQRLGELSPMEVYISLATMILETRAILVEMRFAGDRRLKNVDRAQVGRIAFEEHTTEQAVKENQNRQGYMSAAYLADWFVGRSIGLGLTGDRLGPDTRQQIREHTTMFRWRVALIGRNPFQFTDAGEGK
jgi:hypothetical protein